MIGEGIAIQSNSVETNRPIQQLELDISASEGYSFDQFAIVIHQARFDQGSVGILEGARKGAEAGTCGRTLITRRTLVRVQAPLLGRNRSAQGYGFFLAR
jgi:hypothetical protein